MITVYFWAMHSTVGNVGHVSVKIGVGQAKGLETYVSWWPGKRHDADGNRPVVPHSYEEDVKAEKSVPAGTVSISGLDEAAMKRAWEQMLAKKPNYSLLRKNCAWTVKTLLDVGTGYDLGAAATDALNLRYGGGIWLPRAVFEYAKLLKLLHHKSTAVAAGKVGTNAEEPYNIRFG